MASSDISCGGFGDAVNDDLGGVVSENVLFCQREILSADTDPVGMHYFL